jgi:uncharacterized protein
MKRLIGRLFTGAAAIGFAALAFAQAPAGPIPVPKLTARVIDQTGSLTAAQRDALESKLRAFEAAKGSQIAVLMVPSIGPETIEEFAGRVTDEWKLGRAGVDDGVLLAVAKQERKLRIHTGRGVQGTLTDALSKRIVAEIITPHFRTGDFAGGVDAGADAIMKAIEGEQLPPPKARKSGKVDVVSSFGHFAILGLFIVPIVALIARSILGRGVGSVATSGIAGVAVWFIAGSILFAVIAALIAFLFSLFSGAGITRGARGGGWGGGYIPGGWTSGGGGGGFSGGGGGFSGGGGGFDGGGASGGW